MDLALLNFTLVDYIPVPCPLNCQNGGVLRKDTCDCNCSSSGVYGGTNCTGKHIWYLYNYVTSISVVHLW